MSPHSRVTRFAGLSVSVPDPAATAEFLGGALGFIVSPGSSERIWHVTCQGEYGIPSPLSMLSLHKADELVVNGVKFDVDEDYDLSNLRERLEVRGTPVVAASDESVFEGLTAPGALSFRDPNGLLVCCGAAGPRYEGSRPSNPAQPRRLGHVNATVAKPGKSAEFFIDILGLRLSEQIGEGFYFLRVGSEHHNFGIRFGGEKPGVHHIGFEVSGWESYRVICDHLADLGYKVEYGPGRHGPGRNIFVYLRDPSSGLRFELYSDMAHIQDEATYVPPRWELGDRSNTVNRWGPAPPQSFLDD